NVGDSVNAVRHTLTTAVLVNVVRHKLTTAGENFNGEVQIQALVDKKKVIITETSVRSDLQLEDAEGGASKRGRKIAEIHKMQMVTLVERNKDVELSKPLIDLWELGLPTWHTHVGVGFSYGDGFGWLWTANEEGEHARGGVLRFGGKAWEDVQ
ncbi:hypothetical protein Tco_1087607, partial [Tanacetum coccineum]